MPANIEALPVQKSSIDLAELPKNSFNSVLYGYRLKAILDDVILVSFTDESTDGTLIKRRGLFIPINADTRAWRIGKVLLAGPNVKMAKVGDYVIFPNNLGIPISNMEIEGYGELSKGIFLNEQRIFGIASVIDDNESIACIVNPSATK